MTFARRWIERWRPAWSDRQTLKPRLQKAGILLALFIVLYVSGLFVPIGFDWEHFFGQGRVSPLWTPWTQVVISPLNMPALFALTILAIGLRAHRYRPAILPVTLAIISLPTLWLIHLGNLDGLVLLGLMTLPLGVPLVLMKPQLASFALLANRRWFTAGLIWVAASLILWGLWPLNFLSVASPDWRDEWPQDIALFPWGLLIALPLMWLSRGDEDLLMAAGSFGTPHLFPYHFVLLMPALARMSGPWMLVTWLSSWTPLLANWVGKEGWRFGLLTPALFWLGLYLNKRRKAIPPAAPAKE